MRRQRENPMKIFCRFGKTPTLTCPYIRKPKRSTLPYASRRSSVPARKYRQLRYPASPFAKCKSSQDHQGELRHANLIRRSALAASQYSAYRVLTEEFEPSARALQTIAGMVSTTSRSSASCFSDHRFRPDLFACGHPRDGEQSLPEVRALKTQAKEKTWR
jgi:hypothetical protein